jgi:3-deoxy-7-phosphoheptulonate synthase
MKDSSFTCQGRPRVPISRPYKLASREFSPMDTIFPVNGVGVGSEQLLIIAGPCSVESRSQLLEIAQAVREAGAHALRGGAFKPRTLFLQGMGVEGWNCWQARH